MIRNLSALTMAALVAVSACSHSDAKRSDSALNTDLSLAAQQRGYTPMDSISAAERANALTNAPGTTGAAAVPATRTSNGEVAHTTTRRTSSTRTSGTRRSTASSGSSSGSSAGTVVEQPRREVVVKHTQRDAAIGAAAGAVIGATTSRNKVKGGIIGAAVGGILGGVLGNNVDKQKKPVP